MSEPRFTPGPWSPGHIVDPDHPCGCRFIFADGLAGSVATVSAGGNDSPSASETIANANLISAAPELFTALETCLDVLDNLDEFSPFGITNQSAMAAARAALSKARGET